MTENRINILPRETAELIAAGEVIERPASIAKELIENAVDAGASKITVEIKGGGISYLRVTDNGCGITSEDVPKAFLRHATSKISSKSDLDAIFTLGFRGEALASICAVSDVEVFTKTKTEQFGTHLTAVAGEPPITEKSGCPDGTTVIIRDVFKNVPARLKFLKKNVSEANAVAEIVRKTALSHPEICFSFIKEGENELITSGSGLYAAIYAVFGKQFAASLIPADYEYSGVKITGYVVSPLFGRANRAYENFFINGRYVKSFVMLQALEEAYKNSIMTGKFPASVLHITLPPEKIDVNAHPTKLEVKFSDDKLIYDSIYFAVKNALYLAEKPAELSIGEKPQRNLQFQTPQTLQTPQMFQSPQTLQSAQKADQVRFDYKLPTPEINKPQSEVILPQSEPSAFKYLSENAFVRNTPEPILQPEETPLKIVGEAFATYILAERGEELFIIDKHAAHERILYENIKNGDEKLSCQYLMNYAVVEAEGEVLTIAQTEKEIISKMGFDYTTEGREIRLLGIPSILSDEDGKAVFSELLDGIKNGLNNPLPEILDDIYHSIACKAAIKANDRTGIPEMRVLTERVLSDQNIRYCPHGRPVIFTVKERELERNFKRVT
jgi:DNA mismatch repair protein MutL